MKTIGMRISDKRISSGLSTKELSARLNISRTTLERYENDKIKMIPFKRIEDIALMLDCTPYELVGDDPRYHEYLHIQLEEDPFFNNIDRDQAEDLLDELMDMSKDELYLLHKFRTLPQATQEAIMILCTGQKSLPNGSTLAPLDIDSVNERNINKLINSAKSEGINLRNPFYLLKDKELIGCFHSGILPYNEPVYEINKHEIPSVVIPILDQNNNTIKIDVYAAGTFKSHELFYIGSVHTSGLAEVYNAYKKAQKFYCVLFGGGVKEYACDGLEHSYNKGTFQITKVNNPRIESFKQRYFAVLGFH